MENVVGKTGLLAFHGVPKFRPLVRVLEVRVAYGRERYRVEPVSGEGLMTVDSSRIEFVNDKVIYDAGGGEVIEFETQPSTVERVQEVIRKSGVSAEEAAENITKTSKPKSGRSEVSPNFKKGGKK